MDVVFYDPYKPDGHDKEDATAVADKALEAGSDDQLVREIILRITDGINDRFRRVIKTKQHMNDSVEAGREYVESYVDFIHYSERLFADVQSAGAHSVEHRP